MSPRPPTAYPATAWTPACVTDNDSCTPVRRQDVTVSHRVRLTSGSGYELLLAAVAVADPDWRSVMVHGEAAYEETRRVVGAVLTREVGRLGRFGWINLLGPLAGTGGTRDDLLAQLDDLSPRELHRLVVGGRRGQLQELVDSQVLDAALDGVSTAKAALRRALRSERTILEITPWLLRANDADVRQLCLRVLRELPPPPLAAPSPVTEAVLSDDATSAELIERVAPGVRYLVGTETRFVLVSSHMVAPIVVVVDGRETTLIAHPPLDEGKTTDAAARLRDMSRAAGDHTRIRILQELRMAPRTLADLCRSLQSPRTTLLHHLALLRATGLIEITVADGEPNVYRLCHQGFEEFASAVRGFTIG
jgi:DNA-binding transcriptional ArsR family regulator